jgi:hypothetical protein
MDTGVERLEREAINSPPTSAEVKKTLIYLWIYFQIRINGVLLN